MKIRNKLLQGLMIVLVLKSLFSIIFHLKETFQRTDEKNLAIIKWEERFTYLKQVLPVQRGVVGYIGEWDIPGADYVYWDQQGEFLITQYTLAPLILQKGRRAEWNIAVLSPRSLKIWVESNPGDLEIISAGPGVHIIHDLGSQ